MPKAIIRGDDWEFEKIENGVHVFMLNCDKAEFLLEVLEACKVEGEERVNMAISLENDLRDYIEKEFA